ncbi:MAG: transporter substrate-binding domain-containing protein [Bdellovibrionales bacterium]|nr:transporter substrate-binding domain-containing protein [Bdellovibrionales bacterium]
MIFKRALLLFALSFSVVSNIHAETITINGEDDWSPYSSITGDKKGVEGFAPEIVKAAFKTQGVTAEFKVLPYARCLDEVLKGDAIGCFDTVQDTDSQAKYLFHKTPLFEANTVVFGPANSTEKITKISDLEGKTVGITNGYTYSTEFTTNTKIKKETNPSEKTQLEKIAIGRLAYGVIWQMPGHDIIKKNPSLGGKVKELGTISTDALFVNFSRKHKDGQKYADIFEKGMAAIKADGTYKKLEDDFKKRVGL